MEAVCNLTQGYLNGGIAMGNGHGHWTYLRKAENNIEHHNPQIKEN